MLVAWAQKLGHENRQVVLVVWVQKLDLVQALDENRVEDLHRNEFAVHVIEDPMGMDILEDIEQDL